MGKKKSDDLTSPRMSKKGSLNLDGKSGGRKRRQSSNSPRGSRHDNEHVKASDSLSSSKDLDLNSSSGRKHEKHEKSKKGDSASGGGATSATADSSSSARPQLLRRSSSRSGRKRRRGHAGHTASYAQLKDTQARIEVTGELQLSLGRKRPCVIELSGEQVRLLADDSEPILINVQHELIGATVDAQSAGQAASGSALLRLWTVVRPKANKPVYKAIQHVVRLFDENLAHIWCATLRRVAVGIVVPVDAKGVPTVPSDPKLTEQEVATARGGRLLVIINPFSGSKVAMSLFKEKVEPMFWAAGLAYDVQVTTHSGHATELGATFDADVYGGGVVCVSGDGLLFELLQGIWKRGEAEAQQVTHRVPLGLIPAGSGNGLVSSVQRCVSPEFAALIVCKGRTRPFDAFRCEQRMPSDSAALELLREAAEKSADRNKKLALQSPRSSGSGTAANAGAQPLSPRTSQSAHDWSSENSGPWIGFEMITWGIISDIDISSDKWRWMGDTRFTAMAAVRITSPKFYPGRLAFLPESTSPLVTEEKAKEIEESIKEKEKEATQLKGSSGGRRSSSRSKGSKIPNSTVSGSSSSTSSSSAKKGGKSDAASHDATLDEPRCCAFSECVRCQVGAATAATAASPDDVTKSAASAAVELPEKFDFDHPPAGWQVVDGPFFMVLATNVSNLSNDCYAAPQSHLSDGCLELIYIKNASRAQMTKMLLNMESGLAFQNPEISVHVRVRAVVLEPQAQALSEFGIMDMDGEWIPPRQTLVTVLPSQLSLLCE